MGRPTVGKRSAAVGVYGVYLCNSHKKTGTHTYYGQKSFYLFVGTFWHYPVGPTECTRDGRYRQATGPSRSPNRRELSFHGSKYDAHWQGARCIRRSTRGWRASFSFWECCSCSCGSACASSSYRPSSRDRFVTSTHVLIPLQPRLPPDTSSSACGSCI